jgi:hypothetical protein
MVTSMSGLTPVRSLRNLQRLLTERGEPVITNSPLSAGRSRRGGVINSREEDSHGQNN